MIPIDFVPLPEKEITVLTGWLAQPGYLLLYKLLEAKQVEMAIKAVDALAQKGTAEAAAQEACDCQREAEFYREVLRLLGAVGQGYYDEDVNKKFEYTEMRSKV